MLREILAIPKIQDWIALALLAVAAVLFLVNVHSDRRALSRGQEAE